MTDIRELPTLANRVSEDSERVLSDAAQRVKSGDDVPRRGGVDAGGEVAE